MDLRSKPATEDTCQNRIWTPQNGWASLLVSLFDGAASAREGVSAAHMLDAQEINPPGST